jgi:hypothetical protein
MLLSSRAAYRLQQTAFQTRGNQRRKMSIAKAGKQVISTDGCVRCRGSCSLWQSP